jgi:hypothetical protein
LQQTSSSSSSASNLNVNFPTMPRAAESPVLESNRQVEEPLSTLHEISPVGPEHIDAAPPSFRDDNVEVQRPIPVRSQTAESTGYQHIPPAAPATSKPFSRGDYFIDEREVGVERSDTGGSSGSVVAAMRNRYSSNVRCLIIHRYWAH